MRNHTQQDAFHRRAVWALGFNHSISRDKRDRAIELARIIANARGEDTAIEKLRTKDLRVLSIGAAYAGGSRKGRNFFAREPLHDEQPSEMQIRKRLRDARDRAIEFLKDNSAVLLASANGDEPRVAEALTALNRLGALDDFKRENPLYFEFLQTRYGLIDHIIHNIYDVVSRLNMTSKGRYPKLSQTCAGDIEIEALRAVSSYVTKNEEKIKAARIKFGPAKEPPVAEPEVEPKEVPKAAPKVEVRLRQICSDDLRPEKVMELILTSDAAQILDMIASRLGNGATNADVASLLRREADSFTTIETRGESYYAWKRGGPGRHTPICPVSQGNPADIIRRKAEEIERPNG